VSSLPIDKTCRCFVTNSEQYLIHTLHPGHDTTKLSCLRRVRFGGVNWIYDNSGLSPTVNLKSEYLNTLIAIIVQFTLPRQTRHIRDCFNRPGKGDTNMCRILKKTHSDPISGQHRGGGQSSTSTTVLLSSAATKRDNLTPTNVDLQCAFTEIAASFRQRRIMPCIPGRMTGIITIIIIFLTPVLNSRGMKKLWYAIQKSTKIKRE